MRTTEEREIDGRTWTVTCFPVSEGLKLMVRLGNMLGGPLGKAVTGMTGEGLLDGELDMTALGEAIKELATRLDEDAVLGIIKRLLACATVVNDEGKRVDVAREFDVIFAGGGYTTMFKLLGFVLEVNYGIPLSGWLRLLPLGAGEPSGSTPVSS